MITLPFVQSRRFLYSSFRYDVHYGTFSLNYKIIYILSFDVCLLHTETRSYNIRGHLISTFSPGDICYRSFDTENHYQYLRKHRKRWILGVNTNNYGGIGKRRNLHEFFLKQLRWNREAVELYKLFGWRSAQKINTNIYGCRGKRAVELWRRRPWWHPEAIPKKSQGVLTTFRGAFFRVPSPLPLLHVGLYPGIHYAAWAIAARKNIIVEASLKMTFW
jgi:hypothetical protein